MAPALASTSAPERRGETSGMLLSTFEHWCDGPHVPRRFRIAADCKTELYVDGFEWSKLSGRERKLEGLDAG